MASSGAMADFAALPTQRKVLIFVVLAMLVGALYYQFVFKKLNQAVTDAEAEKNQKLGTDAQAARDIPEYEKLKTRFVELQKIITENQKALPTEAELPAFFDTLQRKVKDSGVETLNWQQMKEEPVETFVKVPVKLEVSGTFLQLKRFFSSLVQKKADDTTPRGPDEVKELERIVSIEGLTLGEAKLVNREIILTARFVAATYRQDEIKTPGKTPGAKPAGGPKAPAAPPMPTAPPMPSSATPAGAKAITEDALKKGDVKSRDSLNEAKPGSAQAPTLKGGN